MDNWVNGIVWDETVDDVNPVVEKKFLGAIFITIKVTITIWIADIIQFNIAQNTRRFFGIGKSIDYEAESLFTFISHSLIHSEQLEMRTEERYNQHLPLPANTHRYIKSGPFTFQQK